MKPIPKIEIDCIPEKEYLSPEFQLFPTSESNGLFIYESSNPAVFTVDQDGVVTITGPGKAYVIIIQLESPNFATNQIDRLIIVNKSKPPITFSGPSSLTLGDTPVSSRILKIITVPELIQNVFSTDESVLKINRILNDEYELIPQKIGEASVIVSTRSNYYFNSNNARFGLTVREGFRDSSIILNINTFQSGFKHDALKEMDILTSNSISEPSSNNIDLTFQQQSRGYQFDVPILNLNAKSFINNVENFDKDLLCCTAQDYLNFSVQWNFNNNIVYDFFPYEGNINDLPRINIFRSDGKYVDYVSGGFNLLKIPPNSDQNDPNAYIYQKWGNRNTGIKSFSVPNVKCLLDSTGTFAPFDPNSSANGIELPSLYYGVDFFTREDLLPSFLFPPENFWEVTTPNPGEKKYQYLFVGNYEKDIIISLAG